MAKLKKEKKTKIDNLVKEETIINKIVIEDLKIKNPEETATQTNDIVESLEEIKPKIVKEKKSKFENPYKEENVKTKQELSLMAQKWLSYFNLHFNGANLLESIKNFKKFKSEKFKFKDELNEIINYLK